MTNNSGELIILPVDQPLDDGSEPQVTRIEISDSRITMALRDTVKSALTPEEVKSAALEARIKEAGGDA